MANPEHLELIKQGSGVWNSARPEHPDVSGADLSDANLRDSRLSGADLSGADLSDANLSGADLSYANLRDSRLSGADLRDSRLSGARLRGGDLSRADLSGAGLRVADLSRANLSGADLRGADLGGAQLSGADLSHANLRDADLGGADLSGANLRRASLLDAKLFKTKLREADMSDAYISGTMFSDVDLSEVEGLESLRHGGPSSIGLDTIYKSPGKIPEIFLRGCGVPDDFITYSRSLVHKAFEFFSCFISYSHPDKSFARQLHDALQGRGIRCWLDEHQLLPGHDIHDEVDRGIRLWDKLLLCCSSNSLTSWWVDKEISTAFDKEQKLMKERREKTLALIPLNLDGYMFSGEWKNGKVTEIKTRLAADFTGWETNNSKFESELDRLVKALRTDSGRESPPDSKL